MTPPEQPLPNQDLVANPSQQPPSANPFAQAANITLSIPETVEVRLVDASALADYEVWILLTSILASAVTGFIVAVVQSPTVEIRTIACAVIFAILMTVCGVTGLVKRWKLNKKMRRIRFRVGDPVDE